MDDNTKIKDALKDLQEEALANLMPALNNNDNTKEEEAKEDNTTTDDAPAFNIPEPSINEPNASETVPSNEVKETIIENTSDVDVNNVKSVFEDMHISTQVVEDPIKPQSMDNAPIEEPKQEEVAPDVVLTQDEQETPAAPEQSELLSSTTIGTVKPDKQKSPIAMIVLFAILVLFMIFMPEVLTFVNNTFGTNINTHTGVNIEEVVEEPVVENKIVTYDFNDKTTIVMDNISFISFVKSIEDEEYKLTFNIKNSGTQIFEFEKKLYFEFFDDSNTFVGRAYLENVGQITGGITNYYKITITKEIYDTATKVQLIERTDDDYPQVTLNGGQLFCTNKKQQNITYAFDENQRLTFITDTNKYLVQDDIVAYTSELITYKSKISNLDRLDGVSAVLKEDETGFITSVVIDYSLAQYSQISSDTNYYMKDTYARVISFEMNSKGYSCR